MPELNESMYFTAIWMRVQPTFRENGVAI